MKRALLALTLILAACGDEAAEQAEQAGGYKGGVGKSDSSAEAVFLEFEFDGQLVAPHCFSNRSQIQDQLLFTIGQLNGEKSLGRLDQLDVTQIQGTPQDGKCLVTYHARMPVAWGKKNAVPATYELVMPRETSYGAADAFAKKYGKTCVDWGAHDVDAGSMWYYYRPSRSGCSLAAEDVFRFAATVSISPIGTTGKYPEYHKVWEDDALRVVAIFGKYEDGAGDSDVGVDGYNKFVQAVRSHLKPHGATTTPADAPTSPGTKVPDVTIEATLPGGRTVSVVALLVDNVRTAGPTFDKRYEGLSSSADLIVYNGHAGLGANIRALASKGKWVQGQYVIVFMNGCDTYAYVDQALAEAHMDVNPDDTTGMKYCDIVTNAMPSFFRSMPTATMALVKGLQSHDKPKTYEQIFGGIDSAEVVLVSGEQDNVYVPGYTAEQPTPQPWAGLSASRTVVADEQARYETPALPAGRYVFTLAGTGDADLYVRVGEAPSLDLFECRPYLYGSKETCTVEITTPAPVHVMIVGWDDTSDVTLTGATQP